MMAVSAVALVAIMGLTLDIGRMYVVKNEAQAYADAGALMAARQLSGASAGILTQSQLLAMNPNRYDLGSREFDATNVALEYAKSEAGPWLPPEAAQSSASGVNFVRVTANPAAALYFLPIVVPQKSVIVPGVAVASQLPKVRLVE
jgi:Flp pilus assembly protein TadG